MAESMTGLKRTHRCAELSEANIGEKVTIMGWVQKNRNKGGLVFVDVRDQQVRLRSNRKNSEFYLNLRHLRSQSKRIPRQKRKYV